MKTSLRFLGLLFALLGVTTTGLQAQKLASGTWTGRGVDPGGEEFPVNFDVRYTGEILSITMVLGEEMRLELSNIRFEEGKLLFRWSPGPVIDCVLSPVEGGGYSGPCTDESGASGTMTMSPPTS